MEKDVDFLLQVLADGREHELAEIMQRSIDERGCGMTIHSRAADLRKRGYKVKNRTHQLPNGRRASFYQLLGRRFELDEAPAPTAAPPAGVSSSPTGEPERLEYAAALPDAPPGGRVEVGEQLSLEAA